MYYYKIIFSMLLSIDFVIATAQLSTDNEIFDICAKSFISKTKSFSLTDIALTFTDKPYRGGTLEINNTEQLVVNLREFDCSTFVESVIALFLTFSLEKSGESEQKFEIFKQNLTKIRYRNGKINGYLSRLHYASDWILNNHEKKVLTDVTEKVGGEKCKKLTFKIDYMSVHPENYPQLKANPDFVRQIKDVENRICTKSFYYIPKSEISSVKNKIEQGDIIFFVTSKEGLDVSHQGIVCRKNNVLTFVHASQKLKKVVVNPESLVDYCMNIKSNKGIIICKINNLN
jgi:hypothetical protein